MNEPKPQASQPDSADRNVALINRYLRRFGDVVGADLSPLDDDGFTEVRHGDLIIGINVARQHGLLVFLVRMGDLPRKPTPELYRTLLEHNFIATGQAAFAVDESKQAIYLRMMRRVEDLDYNEFEDMLQTIASVADDMLERVPMLSFIQR